MIFIKSNEFIKPSKNEARLNLKYKMISKHDIVISLKDKDGMYYIVASNEYPGYYASNRGEVLRANSEGELYPIKYSLSQYKEKDYKRFKAYLNDDEKVPLAQSDSFHRFILKTFRPIDEMDKYVVNHIDGDTLNNNIENLEWVTIGMNNAHSALLKQGHNPEVVGVMARNIANPKKIHTFNLISECAKFCGLKADWISKHLKFQPIDYIRSDGWQFKRLGDLRPWEEITPEYIAKHLQKNTGYIFKDLTNDGKEYQFDHLHEITQHFGPAASTLSVNLSNTRGEETLKAFHLHRDEGDDLIYQIKEVQSLKPWKTYPSIWHALQDACADFVVIVIKDIIENKVSVYRTLTEAGNAIGQKKTAMHYRANQRRDTPWDKRYIILKLDDYTKVFGPPDTPLR